MGIAADVFGAEWTEKIDEAGEHILQLSNPILTAHATKV